MADGGYTIESEGAIKLVSLTLTGFWTADTARAFVRDHEAAVARLTSRPRQHLVLADLTEFNLQSQEVVGICRGLVAEARLPARRLAIVAGDGLARIQIKRITVRSDMEAFLDRGEATEWLLAPDTRARARAAG